MLTYPRLILTLILIILTVHGVHAQRLIKGSVTDVANRPLQGISVLFTNSKTGTSTDSAGRFQFTVPGPGTVVFSGKGYLGKTISFSGDDLDFPVVVLEYDILGMEEVIVTGLATREIKKEYGSAVSVITEKQMQHTASTSLSGILTGRITGGFVTQNSGDPGGGFTLKLRGVGSLFSSSEPLYLIDGIIIDNSSPAVINLNGNTRASNNRLADLSPSDIDNIEVINGPSAAAVYGSRAANGVVRITTKRGIRGGPKVSLFTSLNHNSLREKLDMTKHPFRFGANPSARMEGPGERLPMISNNRTENNPTALGPTANNRRRLDLNQYPVSRFDYQDDIFRDSWGTENSISVSGGSERSSYYFSAGYLNNDGIMQNTSFTRYNFRLSFSQELEKWVKLSGGLNYNNTATRDMPSVGNFFTPMSAINFTDNVWDIKERGIDGELLPVEMGRINPMSMIEKYRLQTETDRVMGNIALDLTPLKGLQIRGLLGLDTYNMLGDAYMGRLSYGNIDQANFPDGYVSRADLKYSQWTADLNASYRADIGMKIQSTSSVGYSFQFISTDEFAQEGRDLMHGVSGLDAALKLSLPVTNKSEFSIYGFFAQQTFGYANQLFLTLAGRVDGSSAFGSNAQNIFYPKASLNYVLSETKFWEKLSVSRWVNTLKLRTAFGKAGNLAGLAANDRFNNYTTVNYTGAGVYLNRYGNEDIMPEIKTEWEGGIDIQFLKSRMGLQFTIYKQEVEGMIIPFSIAPSNGVSMIIDNLGTMENKGLECKLDARAIDGRKFKWDISFLYSQYRNKVTSLYRNTTFIAFDNSQNQGARIGQPMNVYIGSYYARNPDGSFLLKNVDGFMLPQAEYGDPATGIPGRDQSTGQPSGSLLFKVLGDPNPDYQAALHNSFSYGKWGLRVMIDRVSGFQRWNQGRVIRNNNGTGPEAEMELKGEITRGYVAATGNFLGGPINENYVQDASFTKLRELAITYAFIFKEKTEIQLALAGRNLASWDNYDGYDPETNSAGQGVLRGLDYGSIPIPRVVQVSATIKF